jgi:nucleoside-diphosphate-sugar epimerase
MRIAVTGGSGKLGRHVVRRLQASGHDVLNLDATGERWTGWTQVDLSDYGQVADILGGAQGELAPVDAVVHLAAIPAPGLAPDSVTFRTNLTVTFNVLHAAIRRDITRIVIASSETVLGAAIRHPSPIRPGR